jgi:nucleoside phosphorylase
MNRSSTRDSIGLPKAVILTAIPAEYKSVRSHLAELKEEVHQKGTVYERGVFSGDQYSWDVLIGKIGAGNEGAAMEAERAINYFAPSVALFIGVAGGVKDVSIGDVVVGTKIYGYESGAAKKIFQPRPDVGESSYSLIQRAKAEADKKDWLVRLGQTGSLRMPRVYVGPIAAGAKVVKSTRSDTYRFLRTSYGDALAVEMEGRGFLKATDANEDVKALIVRGISDLINKKSAADAGGSQELASHHASAFAFQVLAKLGQKEMLQVDKEATNSTSRHLTTALQDSQNVDKAGLRRRLLKTFDRERLELLCADINARFESEKKEFKVTPEIVGGRSLEAIILNLIEYLDRRNLLDYLLDAIRDVQGDII